MKIEDRRRIKIFNDFSSEFRSPFVPRNVDEEICLLLYLGENGTLNEAVLDWQPEYEKQRERSHQAAYHLLALLAIFLSRKQAFHLIADVHHISLLLFHHSSLFALVL